MLATSAAQAAGFGPRLGLTSEPDQVHVGMQLHLAQMAPSVSFVPSFEVGLGNDVRLFSANMDIKHRFTSRAASWRPYLGGGPAIHFIDRDGAGDESDVGLNFFAGMQTPTRQGAFFGEIRVGLIDSPDFKFTVGWMFR